MARLKLRFAGEKMLPVLSLSERVHARCIEAGSSVRAGKVAKAPGELSPRRLGGEAAEAQYQIEFDPPEGFARGAVELVERK